MAMESVELSWGWLVPMPMLELVWFVYRATFCYKDLSVLLL
jgi:hypothetical protein